MSEVPAGLNAPSGFVVKDAAGRQAGEIIEFEVMILPAKAPQALGPQLIGLKKAARAS